MKNYFNAKALLLCCFLWSSSICFAQTAEETRAKNFLELTQLLTLQAQAPYYLTANNLARIAALKGVSATDVCKNVKTGCAASTILPVTDLLLKGQRINNEKVKLDWETTAEYNSKGFVLERQSIYNTALYDSLVFVNGAGTSYAKSKYSYTDLNNYKGNSFYRIRQVDLDGSITYSNTILVEGYAGKFEVGVAPNPSFNKNVRIYFKGLETNQTVSLIIFNATGVQILKKDNFSPANGYFEIADNQLAQGNYFVTVTSNGEVYTKSFSVIR